MSATRELGRVFVTGADGFIGSHLVETLINAGHSVTALCLYNSFGSYGWLDTAAQRKNKNLHLILGDVRDSHFMDNALAHHDTVFHLASLIAIPYSYHAPQSYVETNIQGTLNVSLAALRAKVKRLIHTSTSEVYGTAQFVPITETHPLQGQSPYSASKIGADMMVQSCVRSYGLPAITLRPFNTYGPRQSMRAVIPTIIAQLLNGKDAIELGSLHPTRDFNYVLDTVNAFVALAESGDDGLIGETFNASCGKEITVGDLVKMICTLVGRECKILTKDDRVRPELSEVERLLGDNSKLRQVTRWQPETSLATGLELLINWMRENKSRYSNDKYVI